MAAVTAPAFTFKVVVAGPFASGKSTFIRTISDIPVVGTEAPTSGDEADVKGTTTVGMEYGTFTVEGDDLMVELFLYGVPGQPRFEPMWDVVAEGMDALLLLVDGRAPDTWPEAARVGQHFHRRSQPPTLVAANWADRSVVGELRAAVPIDGAEHTWCDATDPASARDTLAGLLGQLLERLAGDEPDHGEDLVETWR